MTIKCDRRHISHFAIVTRCIRPEGCFTNLQVCPTAPPALVAGLFLSGQGTCNSIDTKQTSTQCRWRRRCANTSALTPNRSTVARTLGSFYFRSRFVSRVHQRGYLLGFGWQLQISAGLSRLYCGRTLTSIALREEIRMPVRANAAFASPRRELAYTTRPQTN